MSYQPLTLLRVTALALLASGLMLTTGCSNSSDKNKEAAIAGTAIKGTLIGALVEACSVSNCNGENDPLAFATTDENGDYSLDATAAKSSTVILRLRYQDDALMICDAPDGCGTSAAAEIKFGDSYPMPKALTLRSIASVDKSAKKVSVHISPITELVTAAAIESSSGAAALSADAVSKGSDAVRTLLGLDKGKLLTQVRPVDVTKADASKANSEALQLSLLSAAFADADADNTMKKITEMASAVSGGAASPATLNSLTANAKSILNKNAALSNKVTEFEAKLTASNIKSIANCKDDSCSVIPEAATISKEEEMSISQNMAAIDVLVKDVRTLGSELIPQIQNTLDKKEAHTDYDQDNLFEQIELAQTLFQNGTELTEDGSGTIASESMVHVVARLIDGYVQCAADSSCDFTHLKDVDNEEDLEEGFTWSSDTITKSGKTWSVTDAKYTKTNGTITETSTVSVSITFPAVSDLTFDGTSDKITDGILSENADFQLTSAKSVSGDVTVNLTNVSLKVVFDKDLSLAGELKGNIKSLIFAADEVKISNNDVTFTGKFKLEAGASPLMQQLNPGSLNAIAPKNISLNGTFTGANSTKLDAELTFTLDNFDSYGFYEDEQEVKDSSLLNFTITDTGKTLTTVLGKGADKATYVIKYIVGTPGNRDELALSCTVTGSARCPWRTRHSHGNQPLHQYGPNGGPNYTGEKTVLAALDYMWSTNGQELRFYFQGLEADASQYGSIEVPHYITFDAIKNNTAKALTVGDIPDNDDNHALFTSKAKVTGKLSPSLPVMEIGLTVQRTERFAANAELTLDWKSGSEDKHLAVLLSSKGNDEVSMKANMLLQIQDKIGTTIDLNIIDSNYRSKGLVGTIHKDGTKYASITEELTGSGYFITYHFNEKGEKVNKSQIGRAHV